MKLYTVWTNNSYGVHEKCLMTTDGDFVGQETGTFYSRNKYYASPQLKGKIVSVSEQNETGMYHLYGDMREDSEENAKSVKSKFIGCEITLERAHYADGLLIYRCLELGEYFSENEVQVYHDTADKE